ncbi:MAG TPA: transcriptional regulator [Gammaproteobacteria bacterium]|nr:transcriptional regulator [Gammaproteobacteria bacterium]
MSTKSRRTSESGRRSRCPVACTLDLLGDKWTLLVVRDLLLGRDTFKALQESAEKIPSNILAERLKRLEREGIAQRALYQERPPRYRYGLTDKGRDLAPVLYAMLDWGNKYLPGTLSREEIEILLSRSDKMQASD